jgi:alanyl-tRNA synthetase
MTLPSHDTRVTYPMYPAGGLNVEAMVVHTETLPDGRLAVLLDATSCHPVDAGWPDQGPDWAVLRVRSAPGATGAALDHAVVDCVVGATDGQELYVGRDIPVPKGTGGWAFVVVHVLLGDDVAALESPLREGDTVEVLVDAEYRQALSAGHTGCHLASLALNRALAARWRKEVRPDGMGAPDFDGTAIDVSLIQEYGSTDTYRLGKSLRKKGFQVDGLVDALDEVQDAINLSLADWVATDAAVHVERDGELLTDRRSWVCELPEHQVRIPCGGTHVASLGELGELRAALSVADVDGTSVLTMSVRSTPTAAG